MRPGPLFLVCAVSALVAGLTSVSCGGAAGPAAPLYPPYTSQDARLFDDAIDPRVLGVGYDAPLVAPRGDASLFERSQIGDGVVRGRIDTVTVKGGGGSPRFELGIRVLEPLAHGEALGPDFVLPVDHTSPSFGLVRALQSRLSGRNAIVFVRTYSNESGESIPHFHMVPDDPRVANAVREATSLDRVPYSSEAGAPLAERRNEREKAEKKGP